MKCAVCEGSGGIWDAPEEQIIAAYAHVVEQYPEAAFPPDSGWVLLIEGLKPPVRQRKRPAPAAVREAFVKAEAELGTAWNVDDEWFNCPRASLRSHYSRVVRPATSSWRYVSVKAHRTIRILFPLPIIRSAAAMLDVSELDLIGRRY